MMTNVDLLAWRKHMGWTQRGAAKELGITLAAYQALERGMSWKDNSPTTIDRRTELACAALQAGIVEFTYASIII